MRCACTGFDLLLCERGRRVDCENERTFAQPSVPVAARLQKKRKQTAFSLVRNKERKRTAVANERECCALNFVMNDLRVHFLSKLYQVRPSTLTRIDTTLVTFGVALIGACLRSYDFVVFGATELLTALLHCVQLYLWGHLELTMTNFLPNRWSYNSNSSRTKSWMPIFVLKPSTSAGSFPTANRMLL